MDFTLTDTQKAIQKMARDFAVQEIEPVAAERDRLVNWEERMPWDLVIR